MIARSLEYATHWEQRAEVSSLPAFFQHYLSKVPTGNIVELLEIQELRIIEFFRSLPESKLDFAYAEGKWTPKQILLHISDCERVFAYRILNAARQSQTALPGFDHDYWANNTSVTKRDLNSLLVEFQAIRSNTLHLLESLEANQLQNCILRDGTEVGLLGLVGIVYGHPEHHLQVISDRYL